MGRINSWLHKEIKDRPRSATHRTPSSSDILRGLSALEDEAWGKIWIDLMDTYYNKGCADVEGEH